MTSLEIKRNDITVKLFFDNAANCFRASTAIEFEKCGGCVGGVGGVPALAALRLAQREKGYDDSFVIFECTPISDILFKWVAICSF